MHPVNGANVIQEGFTTLGIDHKTVLITGCAGFIGAALAAYLIEHCEDVRIIGIDDLNDYYDVGLKEYRLARIEALAQSGPLSRWSFVRGSTADRETVNGLFSAYRPDIVVHLAAQAGVRYSVVNPDAYIQSNIIGFYHVLEACRTYPVEHLVYASSSSVYGENDKMPYSVEEKTDRPVSLYAATKKADELIAHAYSHLYRIPATGLRFFTVYGPAGRPDMAYFSFAEKMVRGQELSLFNYGNCKRDFTYIDDIVSGIALVMKRAPAQRESGENATPHAVYNIGNSKPENLMDFVTVLKEELQRAGVLDEGYDLSGHLKLMPMQPGDVEATCADVSPLERDFGFSPTTPLREGLRRFAQWYRDYKGQNA